MSLWQDFAEMFRRDSKKYQALFLPDYRVDVAYDGTGIKAGKAYCRLWWVEMRLARDVDWFKQRYPVVHAAIRFNYGGKPVTVPYLAEPGYLRELAADNLDRVIQCNYPLTPLFPFNEGLVELQAGLFTLAASDPIGKFIKTMGRFSALLPVPEFSSVLKIAEPVYRGIEDLICIGNSQLELGYQQTFSEKGGGGNNDLRAGYFVAILAEENQLNGSTLCVVNDSLKVGSPGQTKVFVKDGKSLEGYSYMLFRIEMRTAQDWESLQSIKELVNQAQDAVFKGEYQEVKKTLLPAIRTAIYRTADVTKSDRRAVVLKVEDYLREIGLQGVTEGRRSLYSIMQQPLPEVDAEMEAELVALERLFG